MLPSREVFALHGLHDVELLEPPLTTRPSRTRGSARYASTGSYPLLHPLLPSERITFAWIEPGESAEHVAFRRGAQVLAIDSISLLEPSAANGDEGRPTGDNPNAASTSDWDESDDADMRSTLSIETTTINTKVIRRTMKGDVHAGRDCVVLAWWEDQWGFWLVTLEEDAERLIALPDYVEALLTGEEISPRPISTGDQRASDTGIRSADGRGTGAIKDVGRLCLVFMQLAHCLQALQQRRLQLVASRPRDFAVRVFAPHHVCAIRLDNVFPVAGFDAQAAVAGTDLAGTALFARDAVKDRVIDGDFIRRNLRYLGPEVVSTGRVQDTNCMYSLGALALEAMTGEAFQHEAAHSDYAGPDILADVQDHLATSTDMSEMQSPMLRNLLADSAPYGLRMLIQCVLKLMAKRPEDRYSGIDAAMYELKDMANRCVSGDWSSFQIGKRDALSRFSLPRKPVARESSWRAMDLYLDRFLAGHAQTPYINVWGLSGSGKTQMLKHWVNDVRSRTYPSAIQFRTASASVSKLSHGSYHTVLSIAQSLLGDLLFDSDQNTAELRSKILEAFGESASLFASLLPSSVCSALGPDVTPISLDTIQSASLHTSYKLLLDTVIRLVAKPETPVLISIDDVQWMSTAETEIWTTVINGTEAVPHVFLVTTHRTEVPQAPSSMLGCSPCLNIEAALFTPADVELVLESSVGAPFERSHALASMLHAETEGLPIHTMLLLSNLYKSKAIYFDFESSRCRFDPALLQGQLTANGVQRYLEWLQLTLPENVMECLTMLSLLPEHGSKYSTVAAAMGRDVGAVRDSLLLAEELGIVSADKAGAIRFTHDRHRATSRDLASPARLSATSRALSLFLRRGTLFEECLYECADCTMRAWRAGERFEPARETVSLILRIVTASYERASFASAMPLLAFIDEVVENNGGWAAWLRDESALFFGALAKHTELCIALARHDESFAKLDAALPLARTDEERIRIITLKLHLMLSCNRIVEMHELLWSTLRVYGFDPTHLTAISHWVPKTVEDVRQLSRWIRGIDKKAPAHPLTGPILSLLAPAITTLYSTPNWEAIFSMPFSLLADSDRVHEASYYMLAPATKTISRVDLVRALCDLAVELEALTPHNPWTSYGTTSFPTFRLLWDPFIAAAEEVGRGSRMAMTSNQFDLAAYASIFEFTTRVMSHDTVPYQMAHARYKALRPYLSDFQATLLKIHVQHSMQLEHCTIAGAPWSMQSDFLSQAEIESPELSYFGRANHSTLRLRLAILYDADLADLQALYEQESTLNDPLSAAPASLEWAFLSSIVKIRCQIYDAFDDGWDFGDSPKSIDILFRDRIIQVLADLSRSQELSQVRLQAHEVIAELETQGRFGLAGILCVQAGRLITLRTGSFEQASPYLLRAMQDYGHARYTGPRDALQARWLAQSHSLAARGIGAPPAVLRNPETPDASESGHTSDSTQTPLDSAVAERARDDPSSSRTSESIRTPLQSVIASENTDDPLSIGKASILIELRAQQVLSGETDKTIHLPRLLDLVAQFARADKASIALVELSNPAEIRWKAVCPRAGQYEKADMAFTDPRSSSLGPRALVTRVIRTGELLTSIPSHCEEPFFEDEPAMLLCMPLTGKRSDVLGAVCLSNLRFEHPSLTAQSSLETISRLVGLCLAE